MGKDFVPAGKPRWADSDGFGCLWYAANAKNNCKEYGTYHQNDGKTARQACCACGGGTGPPNPTAPGAGMRPNVDRSDDNECYDDEEELNGLCYAKRKSAFSCCQHNHNGISFFVGGSCKHELGIS